MIYIAVGLVFLTLLLLFSAIMFGLFYRERAINHLRYYKDVYKYEERAEMLNTNKKRVNISILKMLSKIVPKVNINTKRADQLKTDLIMANIQLKVEELFVIKVLSSSFMAFTLYALYKDSIISIVVFIVTWCLPRFFINAKKNKRKKLFDEQINDGIMIISNSLKAGHSFLQAISVVVEETQDPFSGEFKKLLKEMSLGVTMDEALKNMLGRMSTEDLELIINAILIQKDIGGNLSEILDNISGTIRERQKIANEVKTLTAQGKLSGWIVALMPVFLGGMIYVFNKEYMILLFTTTIGKAMVGAALVSQIIGIMIISKIVKIEL